MNPNAQTLNISLRRNRTDEPWGFRLQGGIDFKTPLSVQTVNPGGVAERCGIQASDAMLSINGNACEVMEHDEAKRYLIMAGLDVNVVVQRGALKVWKPKVTPMTELRTGAPQQNYTGGEQFVQQTSLAADKQEPLVVGSAHNRTARPFAGFGGPSSVGVGGAGGFGGPGNQGLGGAGGPGYGDQQMQGSQQYGGYQQGPQGQGQGGHGGPGGQGYAGQQNYSAGASSQAAPQNVGAFDPRQSAAGGGGAGPGNMPSGMKSVRAPVFDPNVVQQQVKNHPVCSACKAQIIGVFVKVRGEPFHPACFKCFTCGKNLKNQGYYEYDGQLYCDSHGPASTQ